MKQYKTIRVKWDIDLIKVNEAINDMTKEGWELVCMSSEPVSSMFFVLAFSKNSDDT